MREPSSFSLASLLARVISTGILVSAILVVYVLISVVYNLCFHPLRHFPGPPLARVTRLWARIGNFHGRKSERVHAAHVKYGSVVRVGPNELSFSDPGAVKDIYTTPGDVFVKEETFYVGFSTNSLYRWSFFEAMPSDKDLV